MTTNISIVIPVYNEEKNIKILYKRLIETLDLIVKNFEIIFIDDGSRDHTQDVIREISKKDNRVKMLSFSRNFGHMAAVNAGLNFSSGKKVVIMDADLQDPPEVIIKMYKKSEEYDVIYGIKKNRKENIIRRCLFNLFYKLLNSVSDYKMPYDAGTFSLIDRKVVDILINMQEKNKYFSGLRAWVGFSQTGVVYERAARHEGKPASYKRLIKLGLDGIFSFSYIPLRLASIFGFICAGTALLSIFLVLALRLIFGWGLVGWASTISIILLVSGVQLITLGIIGEYLARIYDEVKGRPEYIVANTIGFDKKT